MANYIKNRLTLNGSEEQVHNLITSLSTFFPSVPRKSYDGRLVYENKETDSYGWLNEESNIFTHSNRDEVVGIPNGFEQSFELEWTRFPDFEKIITPPDDPAYHDEPSQEVARNSPNWWDTWNRANWGTKWNCFECEKLEENVFQFETAWNGVPDLINAMSVKFPDVEIQYEYSDEDTGYNCGAYTFKAGFHKGGHLENGSTEAYKLSFKLRPEYAKYYKLVDGEYVYKEEE